jgi:hypothetical protein
MMNKINSLINISIDLLNWLNNRKYNLSIALFCISLICFFEYVQEYCPYQYDISRLPECAYANRHYYKITFCLQDD